MLTLKRYEHNPILTPSEQPWENLLVFNPASVLVGDSVYMIYRAMGKDDEYSRLGLAISKDGIHFERKLQPLYSGNGQSNESLGVEDPRVVQIDDRYYLTYTAVSEDFNAEIQWKNEGIIRKPMIALSTTKDFHTFADYDVIIPDVFGKDASLFPAKINGEYCLIYREGEGKTYFAKSSNLTTWQEKMFIFQERPGFWDCKKTGIGAPPLWTEKGWLLFYHGIDNEDIYRLGIMFLDLTDPSKVLYRSPEPIFEPEKDYETSGYVKNVVFTCGVVEKNNEYYVYYGAADRVIGLATVEKEAVLALF